MFFVHAVSILNVTPLLVVIVDLLGIPVPSLFLVIGMALLSGMNFYFLFLFVFASIYFFKLIRKTGNHEKFFDRTTVAFVVSIAIFVGCLIYAGL